MSPSSPPDRNRRLESLRSQAAFLSQDFAEPGPVGELLSRRATTWSGSAQATSSGRWRRSGEGDHKGRPYDSSGNGDAAGGAD